MEKNVIEKYYDEHKDETGYVYAFGGECFSAEELEKQLIYILTYGLEDLDIDIYEVITYLGKKWGGGE